MSLILNIDTSTESASVALAENGRCLNMSMTEDQKGQSTWIHTATQQLFAEANKEMNMLDAVAITAGPGSYTGLRVGMATAKGLCYALEIPIIALSTLEAMAYAAREVAFDYICPMMDAGRMEVYTALYTPDLTEIIAPTAKILDETSFSDILQQKSISFIGKGKNKFEEILNFNSAVFPDYSFNAAQFTALTYAKFLDSHFSSLAYLEPIYLKEYGAHIY